MNITGEISYKLEGNVNISFMDRLYNLTKARFTLLLTEGDEIVALKMVAKFSAGSIRILANHFPGLKAFQEGIYSYSFLLKEQVLQENCDKLSEALNLEDLLKVNEGICLKLDNYDFQGYSEI